MMRSGRRASLVAAVVMAAGCGGGRRARLTGDPRRFCDTLAMATRICPDCGAQYVATVRRCIDCETTENAARARMGKPG